MDRVPGSREPKKLRLFVKGAAVSDYRVGDRLDVDALECLRLLPGRRSVWRGRCAGQVVLLKVFDQHPKQGRDAGREWENTLRLHGAGLPIAVPLFHGEATAGELVVAFEFISDGRTLIEVLADGDDEVRAESFRQLIEVHAKQHACGSFQRDDHLGNYMWSGGRLYILDAGSCVFRAGTLGMNDRVVNMAMLTANIPLKHRGVYDRLLLGYLGLCTDDIDGVEFAEMMDRKVPEAVKTRLWKYLRKTRRSSSKLERSVNAEGVLYVCRDVDRGIRRAVMEFAAGDGLGNEITVDGVGYVIRRYDAPSLLRRIFSAKSQALEDWSVGHALRMVGMRVPRPLVCLLQKNGEGFLLLKKVEGLPLDELTVAEAPDDLPGQFAAFWDDLRCLGVRVGGVRASHFVVDEHGRFTLLDMSGIRFDPSGRIRDGEIERALAGLFDSWQGNPEVCGLLREAV